jgi:hypothetical protein
VQYFACLLGVDLWSLHPTVSKELPHAFFITSSAVQSACPSLGINRRLLNYAISHASTVILQHMWFLSNSTDAQCFANVSLNMPIFFIHKDCITLLPWHIRCSLSHCDRPCLVKASAKFMDLRVECMTTCLVEQGPLSQRMVITWLVVGRKVGDFFKYACSFCARHLHSSNRLYSDLTIGAIIMSSACPSSKL